jgi:hypothetical protein
VAIIKDMVKSIGDGQNGFYPDPTTWHGGERKKKF